MYDDTGLPGRVKIGVRSSPTAEALRLAGLHRDRAEPHRPERRERLLDHVVVALGDAAAGDHHVGADQLVAQRVEERPRLVGHDADPVGDRAGPAGRGREQEGVAVVDRVVAERRARARAARSRSTGSPTRGRGPGPDAWPGRRRRAGRGGAGRGRCRRSTSTSPLGDVLAGAAGRAGPASGAWSIRTWRDAAVGPLVGHDASAPAGTGAPVMILTAVPGRQREQPRLAGADLADHRQVHRRVLGRASTTSACADGVPVHRGVVEGRQRRSAATTSSADGEAERLHQRLREGRQRLDVRRGSGRRCSSTRGRRVVSHPSRRAPCRRRPAARSRASSVDVADHLHAVAEGPVALDLQRRRLLHRRRALGEALVELADQLVVVAVEVDERHRRRRPGRARSPGRCRRRRSAAPAGRWWSSPARTGRGRPRSAARPRRPRSPRPSRSRSGSPRACDGSPGSTVLTLRISGRPRMPSRRVERRRCIARRSNHRLLVEQNRCRSRSAQRLLVLRRASARSRAARSGRRSCGARSGRPCGRTAYAGPPRSRTAHRDVGEPAGDPGVGHGAEVVGVGDEDAAGSRPRSAGRAGRCRAARCRGRRGRAGTTRGRGPSGSSTGDEVLGQQLGLLVLQELQRQAVDRQVLVAGQRRHGVGARCGSCS